ncbi:MAG: NAD(P)-binding domain-containing protein [Saprospiraceae bacterium]|nr:NAD(P)-binding domain-containing protein [Saprospiraceae bacterium]
MKIAIIGSGNVGGALAQQWIKAGHTVLVGARFPLSDKNTALASIIGEDRFTDVASAVAQCDAVLIASPPTAILDIIESMGDVSGKALIDATNAVRQKPEPYQTVYHALVDKTGANVVKCFNTTGFENMLNPDYGHVRLDMFMAGDSDTAKDLAEQLAKDAGFENCYDFGGADRVELLEQFAMAWINLAIFQKMGRNVGFKLVRR